MKRKNGSRAIVIILCCVLLASMPAANAVISNIFSASEPFAGTVTPDEATLDEPATGAAITDESATGGSTTDESVTCEPATGAATTDEPTTAPHPAEKQILLGDVEKDGIINVIDVSTLQLMIIQCVEYDAEAAIAADVDLSGSFSVADVTMIQRYLSELDGCGSTGKTITVSPDDYATLDEPEPVEDETETTEPTDEVEKFEFVRDYVRGTPSRADGSLLTQSYLYRCVNKEIQHTDSALYAFCTDDYFQFAVVTYNEDGTLKSYGKNVTSCVIEPDSYFRITIRKVSENTSQPANTDEYSFKVIVCEDVDFDYPLTNLQSETLDRISYRPMGELTKPYICLCTDDGRSQLATYTIPMFIQKNVPLTMCLWSTSEVMLNSTYRAQVIDAVENHGFEVAQHGERPWANGEVRNTCFDEKSLYMFWEYEREAFKKQGITVADSAACPYGYTNQRVIAQVGNYFGVHRAVYNPNDSNIVYYPYYCTGPKSNLNALRAANIKGYSLKTWKRAVDYAIANNYVLCIYFHDWDLDTTDRNDNENDDDNGTRLSARARLETLIDYAKHQDITFCNLSDIPNLE